MKPHLLEGPDGVLFRDLNHNGIMEPYEDSRLPVDDRVNDLLNRMTIEEKVGLLFHSIAEVGQKGEVVDEAGHMARTGTTELVTKRFINHVNLGSTASPSSLAQWNNTLQTIAETTPHGIPVTISTDPLHGFLHSDGASFSADGFSTWPEPLGLAAIGDANLIREFADIARQEYLAVGIRSALHPQIDLASEPRWSRQVQTLGSDATAVSEMVAAYLKGFQGDKIDVNSVACTTKHFPGGGTQKNGEDAHFPYGREQVYPGGRFDEHLEPFRSAIARGTAAMMPYYGMPIGLELNGEPVEEVGFGFNRQIITGLLRDQLGYDGVVVTDWELISDHESGGKVLPARAWGVEDLSSLERVAKVIESGADQFGGEECTELVLELIRCGRMSIDRLDQSARRLLRVKFQLGLFDDPYVDEESAAEQVGRPEHVQAGLHAQASSITVLANSTGSDHRLLPDLTNPKLYLENVDPASAARFGTIVDDPAHADLAIVRLHAPFDPRDDLFFERSTHQGSLEFRPGLISRLTSLASEVPLLIDVFLDRPAILAPIAEIVTSLTVSFGCSDDAYFRAVSGEIRPCGRLPFEVPQSMNAVRSSKEDIPNDTANPTYSVGFRAM